MPPFAVADIRTLLLNMQHLINSFRPYQARAELIAAVQAQVDAKQRLLDGLRDASTRAAELGVDETADGESGEAASEAAARDERHDEGGGTAAAAGASSSWELAELERLLGTQLGAAGALPDGPR